MVDPRYPAAFRCDTADVVPLAEVFRAYVRELVGDEPRAAFAERTGIPEPDLSLALRARPKRGITLGQLQKISRALGIQPSDMFHEMARIAMRMEQAEPVPAEVASRGLALPPFREDVGRVSGTGGVMPAVPGRRGEDPGAAGRGPR